MFFPLFPLIFRLFFVLHFCFQSCITAFFLLHQLRDRICFCVFLPMLFWFLQLFANIKSLFVLSSPHITSTNRINYFVSKTCDNVCVCLHEWFLSSNRLLCMFLLVSMSSGTLLSYLLQYTCIVRKELCVFLYYVLFAYKKEGRNITGLHNLFVFFCFQEKTFCFWYFCKHFLSVFPCLIEFALSLCFNLFALPSRLWASV